MIIRATAFFFRFSSKTKKNLAVAILRIILTLRGVVIARYDIILNQSEGAHLYNHLSNYTNDYDCICLLFQGKKHTQKALWFAETYGLSLKSLVMEDPSGCPISIDFMSDTCSSASDQNKDICKP